MARVGELSAGIAVLGMLVERPDTAAGLGVRLREQYPDAGWDRSILHHTLPRLVSRGHVAVRVAAPGRSVDWLEPTDRGREFLAGWLREASASLPVLRDSRVAKLRLIEHEDQLAAQVRDIWDEADLCAGKGEEAIRRYDRARREARLRPDGRPNWQVRRDRALLRHQATFWISEATRLRRLAAELEGAPGDDGTLAVDD